MAPLPREEFNDLGFGNVVASEGGTRLLNPDGSFNVYREGLNPLKSLSLYHFLLTVSWTRFLLLVSVAYVAANAAFAGLYLLCGHGSLTGGPGLDAGSRYMTAFFFSVHTLATIGYGTIAPHGFAANAMVVVESLVGLLGFALASGLVFARFSRPVAWIIFSHRALVSPYRGCTALMFRLVNGRSNQLVEVQAKVSLGLNVDGRRVFYALPLEREKVVLFPLSWTVVHPIDEASPMWGMTRAAFDAADAEMLVTIEAIDETFAQQVQSRTSYKAREVVWGAHFADMFVRRTGRPLGVDVCRLSEFSPADLPAASEPPVAT